MKIKIKLQHKLTNLVDFLKLTIWTNYRQISFWQKLTVWLLLGNFWKTDEPVRLSSNFIFKKLTIVFIGFIYNWFYDEIFIKNQWINQIWCYTKCEKWRNYKLWRFKVEIFDFNLEFYAIIVLFSFFSDSLWKCWFFRCFVKVLIFRCFVMVFFWIHLTLAPNRRNVMSTSVQITKS
jgi:hypothetical protein